MQIASKSDKGMIRDNNQDSYAAGEIRGAAWAVVCDGMGGAKGGNIASSKAVKIISECITNSYHSDMSSSGISAMLCSAAISANLNIYDSAESNASLSGMGTTVVAIVISGTTATIVHAGDSRAYLFSKDSLVQITRDHSVVQSMIENGQITADEAMSHPRKNVITRALGVNENVDMECSEASVPPGSGILICTDGLTNFVGVSRIRQILMDNKTEDCPQLLIDEANKNGGGDNVTAVIIKND